jgi:hypothetical protein
MRLRSDICVNILGKAICGVGVKICEIYKFFVNRHLFRLFTGCGVFNKSVTYWLCSDDGESAVLGYNRSDDIKCHAYDSKLSDMLASRRNHFF